MEKQSLHLYLEGFGFRSIGKILGMSNVSIQNWIRSFDKSVGDNAQSTAITNSSGVAVPHTRTLFCETL
jgi:transposase-like protein